MKTLHNFSSLAARWVTGLAVVAAAFSALAQPKTDSTYQPQVWQAGKDVVWVPTPDELVTKMLQAAKVTKDDLVYDLGAGDGKIAIAAGLEFGARAVGIEYNPDMAAFAQRNAERAGVADRVRIIRGDIFVEDFSQATVVTMYLLPELNLRLRPTLLKMKPGTRLVTNSFSMGDWEPDQVIRTSQNSGYFWIVPAQVQGRWNLNGIDSNPVVSLDLHQRYQHVGGTITIGKLAPQTLLTPELQGDQLRFRFVDTNNRLQTVKATVRGNQLEGEVGNTFSNSSFKGSRS